MEARRMPTLRTIRTSCEASRYVVVDEGAEAGGELFVGAAERREVLTVDEDGAIGRFAGAGQADADACGLRFSRTVDDASHHREREGLDPFVPLLPLRHLLADVVLRALGQLLERAAGGPAAPGTRGHARRK